MRAWLLFLPILLFAQPPSSRSKSVPVGNDITSAKGAKGSAPKKAEAGPEAPTATSAETQVSSDGTQQSDKASSANKSTVIPPDPIVRYTFWLVMVGGFQFAALIIQAFFLWMAFRQTTRATGLTEQALREAQRSNAANEALTLESNTAGRMSADAAKSSADMLLAAERAWVLIELGWPQSSMPLGIKFQFKNYGRTPAWITEFRLHFTKSPTKELGPINYSVLPGMPCRDEVVAPGHPTGMYTEKLDGTGLLLQTEEREIINGSLHLHFFGMIKYRDISTAVRQTNFCFTYLPKGSITEGYFFSTGTPEANKCT